MALSHFVQKRVVAVSSLLAAILTIMMLVQAQPAQAMSATILYSFSGPDGASPRSHLLRDPRTGNLYGITNSGGDGYGTVFELKPPSSPGGIWAETVLHQFEVKDGEYPTCLIRDATGNLYGTTMYGGSSGWGIVFELAYSTKTKTYSFEHLYNFTGKADGAQPVGLIRDKYGNLFGTAQENGAGYGTLWKIDSTGFHLLYSFDASDSYPTSALAVDAGGDLYVAITGGAYSQGAILELAASGSTKLLYSFQGRLPSLHSQSRQERPDPRRRAWSIGVLRACQGMPWRRDALVPFLARCATTASRLQTTVCTRSQSASGVADQVLPQAKPPPQTPAGIPLAEIRATCSRLSPWISMQPSFTVPPAPQAF